MKRCVLCGVEIVPGENGCTMYDTCFSCKPIHYPKNYSTEPQFFGRFDGQGIVNDNAMPDYEGMILDRQDSWYDD